MCSQTFLSCSWKHRSFILIDRNCCHYLNSDSSKLSNTWEILTNNTLYLMFLQSTETLQCPWIAPAGSALGHVVVCQEGGKDELSLAGAILNTTLSLVGQGNAPGPALLSCYQLYLFLLIQCNAIVIIILNPCSMERECRFDDVPSSVVVSVCTLHPWW